MILTTASKKDLFQKFGFNKSNTDTGSPESQIALFTERIKHITEHLKENKKDFASQQGLMKLVGKRKRLLNYLQNNDINRYRAIISQLELRK
ncbi:MAG: 30S ribosomal protein S15 [Cyclobacteriaceae bacterium]|jgi:small subunit ribosomal protein S15|nr:30S ribosomal protein S15 [Flammeovirgaceae bacterium]MCZ8020258.1 30S ribosomal protein S15 [Cytophagales bacterium]MCZ8327104.1 30S ribosomal protein S15 [Cyclobacteriaceae bacterium]